MYLCMYLCMYVYITHIARSICVQNAIYKCDVGYPLTTKLLLFTKIYHHFKCTYSISTFH